MPQAGEIVERVIALGHHRLAEALELMHADAEWVPDPDLPPLRGHAEIRAHVEREIARLGEPLPEALPLMLVEDGERVVVFGQVRTPRARGERRYVEVIPMAWLYELREGSIARVCGFHSWDDARAAAQLPVGAGPTRRL